MEIILTIINSNNETIAYLNNLASANVHEVINGEYTLNFIALIEPLKTGYFYDKNNLIVYNNDYFRVVRFEELHNEDNMLTVEVTAVSLDGGGSSTMALDKDDGQGYKVINKLYNNYQRYITSALLVYSKEEYEVVNSFTSKPVEEDIGYRMVLYSHLKTISAVEGEMVHCQNPWSPASIIGIIGDTGKSTGIHLHICVIKGKRDNLWILLDMTKDVIPDREELNWFTDDTLFDYPIVVTGDWLSYLNHFAKDVVPADRKTSTAHYEIKWNRSFSGRVLKTGYNEFHGNYVLVWYDILPM